MSNEELVQSLVDGAVKAMKNFKFESISRAFDSTFRFDDQLKSLPKFNPIYRETVLHHNRIAVHNELDVFPYAILRVKAPNQSPEEWDYQRGLYKSYTNSTWERAKNKTKIVGNNQNYSISGWDESQKDYFYTDYPEYHNLESYFFEIVRDKKINYPNQVALIRPSYIPGEYDEEGNFKVDDTVMVSPIVEIIEEEDIITFVANEYLFILTEDDAEYTVGTNKYADGLVFQFYDKNDIWEIRQVGKDKDFAPTFDYKIIYTHNWGYVPARKLGGKPIKCEHGNMLFHSHFISAVPDLESVIQLSSNLDMSLIKLGFPIIIAVVDQCSYKATNGEICRGGYILNNNGENHQCPSCQGSGKARNHSPTGVYEVAATMGVNQANVLAMTPPVQFAAPDPSILEHISNQIKGKKESAFSNLFETDPAKSNTATGVALEKEEFYSFITQFSNELFNLLDFAIEGIGWMRYGSAFVKPSLRKPTSFDIRDISQVTTEIGEANKNNMTASYKQALNKEAVAIRFGISETEIKKNDLIYKMDRLWDKTTVEIRAMVGVTCTKLDAIIHDSINTFIDNAAADNEDFWDMDFEEQKNIILDYAKAVEETLQPKGGSLAADVMAGATG